MDPAATLPAEQEPSIPTHPLNAFERISYEVVEIEALVNAACTAIDACAPPENSRLAFDRAQALIGNAADKAAAALALIGELKASIDVYALGRR
jgi:hypothetical protein